MKARANNTRGMEKRRHCERGINPSPPPRSMGQDNDRIRTKVHFPLACSRLGSWKIQKREGLEGRSNGEMAAVWRGRVAQVARGTG